LPTVKLVEGASITRLESPNGRVMRRKTTKVPVDWALYRLKDANLMFVFEESDREELLKTDEKTLRRLSRVMGEELKSASDLADLLLPKVKKAGRPKKAKVASSLTKKE